MNDPWEAIIRPSGVTANAKRADEDHPFDFFWALDTDGHCLLVYEYDRDQSLKEKAPRLKGIGVITFDPEGTNKSRLILSLRQAEHKEIFFLLCKDIIEATRECKDSKGALQVMIRRTWRWHQLLRGERDGRLSPEAQKGLIGELQFLSRMILSNYSPAESMSFWEGPSGSPKDFVIGKSCVEVKARDGAARPYISISSEHQLDHAEFENVYLYVADLSPAAVSDKDSFNLNDFVDRTLEIIRAKDSSAVEIFDAKLLEVGYLKEDDYSDQYWLEIGSSSYEVKEDFPRIVDSELPDGLEDIKYKLDLEKIKKFQIDLQALGAPPEEAS